MNRTRLRILAVSVSSLTFICLAGCVANQYPAAPGDGIHAPSPYQKQQKYPQQEDRSLFDWFGGDGDRPSRDRSRGPGIFGSS